MQGPLGVRNIFVVPVHTIGSGTLLRRSERLLVHEATSGMNIRYNIIPGKKRINFLVESGETDCKIETLFFLRAHGVMKPR